MDIDLLSAWLNIIAILNCQIWISQPFWNQSQSSNLDYSIVHEIPIYVCYKKRENTAMERVSVLNKRVISCGVFLFASL